MALIYLLEIALAHFHIGSLLLLWLWSHTFVSFLIGYLSCLFQYLSLMGWFKTSWHLNQHVKCFPPLCGGRAATGAPLPPPAPRIWRGRKWMQEREDGREDSFQGSCPSLPLPPHFLFQSLPPQIHGGEGGGAGEHAAGWRWHSLLIHCLRHPPLVTPLMGRHWNRVVTKLSNIISSSQFSSFSVHDKNPNFGGGFFPLRVEKPPALTLNDSVWALRRVWLHIHFLAKQPYLVSCAAAMGFLCMAELCPWDWLFTEAGLSAATSQGLQHEI